MPESDLRRDQPVPLYYQVEIALRRAIEAGQFPDGRLPTEDDLRERFAVSRITVRSALRRLEEDGLIERHRARGTFVRADATTKIERAPGRLLGFETDLRRQGISPAIQVLAYEVIEPPAAVARDLGAEPGATAHRLRRLGLADGEPLWLESRYFPEAVGQRMAGNDLSAASLTNLLQDVLGVRVDSAYLRVEAESANTRQARHLGVRRGHPLLVNQCTFFDTGGRPLEVLRAVFRGDRYAFTFDLASRPADNQAATWPALIAQAAPPQCPQRTRSCPSGGNTMMPLPHPIVERPRSSRRAFLRGALAMAGASSVASLLAACSQAPQAAPNTTVAPAQGGAVPTTAAAAATPRTGGALTFAQNQPIKKADSVDPQTYPAAYEANFTVFSNLVTFDADLKIVPDLAEKWEASPDGTTWAFHLRRGVTFHDGTPFTAAAVQAHVKRIQDPKTASPNANLWQHITDVKVVDDATIQLTTAKPFGPMLNYLAHGSGGIPSPAAIEKYGDQFGQHPTGTGRYKLDSFTPGAELVLTRNDAYFGGKPALDRIRFRPVPEVGSRVAALEASEVDVINDMPPEEAQRLEKTKGIQILRKPGLRTFWMEFNLNLDIFKDKQVRQALNYAVDKEAIVKSLFLGFASVLDSPAAATIQGYTSAGSYAYNPQKANQLLDAAGWTKGPDGVRQKDGTKLQFTINTAEGEYPKDLQYVEAVQANLKAAGCDPQIWKVEAASRWSYLRLAPSEAKGEMISFGFNPSNGDLGYHLNAVFRSNKDRSKAPDVWNLMWYENTQVDSLLDQAQTTADQAKRFEILGQAQKLIWEDAPVIFLHAPDLLTGIRDTTRDVVVWPTVFTVVRGASKG